MKATNNHHANRHHILLRFLAVLSTFYAVAADCAAGYTGGWNNLPSLISLIDARDTANAYINPSSSSIPDLSGTSGMTWSTGKGSTSFVTVDGIPCWNLNGGLADDGYTHHVGKHLHFVLLLETTCIGHCT